MDKLPKLSQTNPVEEFSLKAKFEILLGLFGSEKARQNFISLCNEYNVERVKRIILQDQNETFIPKDKVAYSPPKRADLHNKIMEIISKLAVQSKKITLLQEAVLRDFHSREYVAEAIKEFISTEKETTRDGGEELSGENGKNMSGVAYFHSLGNDH
ncbi:hypothetical protein KKG24_01650 [Patescibacteria group bacterium]|nr:hypothetical protein [Patescibacteria group bacterium]